MRFRSLVVGAALAATSAIALLAPACTDERKTLPTSDTGQGPTGSTPVGDGGAAGGTADGGGGRGGSGGDGGDGGDGGRGGGQETLPQCACLLDQVATPACGTCVSFAVVDQCEDSYSECQVDADCKAIDNCVLNEACDDSACLELCRDLGPSASRATFDAMYNCACGQCNDDCDTGDSCN